MRGAIPQFLATTLAAGAVALAKAAADANATTDGGASPDTGAPARPTTAP